MADVQINAAPSGDMHRMGAPGALVMVTADIGYAIFINSAADLMYQKTTDGGASWAGAVTIRTGTLSTYSVWFDKRTPGDSGTKIHVSYLDSGTDLVYYRSLDTSNDSLGTETTVFTGVSFSTGANDLDMRSVSITKARGGNLYIWFNADGGTETGFYRSVDSGANWTSRTNFATTGWVLLVPATTGDTQDVGIFRCSGAVSGAYTTAVYDDSANTWTSAATIASGLTLSATYFQMAVTVRPSDGEAFFVAWNAIDSATGDLIARRVTLTSVAGAPTVNSLTNVITDTAEYAQCCIFIDYTTEDLYVGYLGGSVWATDSHVYYKRSTDSGSTWGGQVQVDETLDDQRVVFSDLGGLANRFIMMWINNDLDDLMTNKVNSVIMPQRVTANGIATAEAIGSPTVDAGGAGSQTVTPNGIATAEAIGSPNLNLRLLLNAIASGEGIGSPILSPQAVTLLINSIASGEAVGSPLVVAGNSIFPNGIPSAFGAGVPMIQYRLTPVGVRPPGFSYSGYGTSTQGGNSGTRYVVTNTNNSGAGSFRDAVSTANRYVVFDPSLSGATITLLTLVDIHPNITIDGSTLAVPITISGKTIRLRSDTIGCQDVIIRYLRIINSDFDNIQILGTVSNVVVDHCTLYMATDADGNLDITEGAHDITVSWCLIHKAAGVGKNSLIKYAARRVSVHHNLFYSQSRNPQIQEDDSGGLSDDLMVDLRNNIFWDWGPGEGPRINLGAWANVVRNFFSKGSGDGGDSLIVDTVTDGRAYVLGNVSEDAIDINTENTEEIPLGSPPIIFQETDACLAAELVLRDAGARSITGTLPSVDQAVIDAVAMSVCSASSEAVLDSYLQKNRSSEMGSPHVAALIVANGVVSAEAIGSPILGFRIFPNGIVTAEAIGSPVLNLRLLMNGIATAEAIGGPILLPQALTIHPDAVPSQGAMGSPQLNLRLFPNGLASAAAFGAPTIAFGAVTIQLAGLASVAALGSPTLGFRIFPAGLASAGAIGVPTLAGGSAIILSMSGLPSAGAIGSLSILPQPITISMAGISSGELIGSLYVTIPIRLSGLDSAEAIGFFNVASTGPGIGLVTGWPPVLDGEPLRVIGYGRVLNPVRPTIQWIPVKPSWR